MRKFFLASIVLMISMRMVAQDCTAVAAAPVLSMVQPTCTSSNASITVTSPLPAVGISYKLVTSGGVALPTNSSGLFESLDPGTYTVTVSITGCTDSPPETGTINAQPPTPTLVINQPAAVTGSATIDITAAVITAGSMSNNANALTYTYFTDAADTQIYATPTAATAGTYYVKADNGQCTTSSMLVILGVPVAADFKVSNLSQMLGSIIAVAISPKAGKSTGAITVMYNGSTTLPTTAGVYSVKFDVAADSNYAAVTGLIAGALLVTPATPIVTVVDNCDGTSLLTSDITSGTITWSTGETTRAITVNTAGVYTVAATENGYMGLKGKATAAPKTTPATPVVTVVDNCGTSVLTSDITSGVTSGVIAWSTQETTPAITVTKAGEYTVTTTVNGCTSLPAIVTANTKAVPATPVVTVTQNVASNVVTIAGVTGEVYSFNSGAYSAQLVYPNLTPAIYSVTAQNALGCVSAETKVTVFSVNDAIVEMQVYNGITPNGDGINDSFVIIDIEKYKEIKLNVFDVNGNIVFTGSNYNNKDNVFSGAGLPLGVYYYVIDYVSVAGKHHVKSGYLYLNQ